MCVLIHMYAYQQCIYSLEVTAYEQEWRAIFFLLSFKQISSYTVLNMHTNRAFLQWHGAEIPHN